MNWLKNRPTCRVHLLLDSTWMPTQRWGNRVLVAEVRWRRLALRCLLHVTRASCQIVLDPWQQASSRIAQTECTHSPELLVHRTNQWASTDVCDKKRERCGAIMNYIHSAAAIAHKEAKAKTKERKKLPRSAKSRTDCRGSLYQGERGRCLSKMRPRTSRVQHRFGTDLALPWMESRRNTVCFDQSVPRRSRRTQRVDEYQPYRRLRFSEWFLWPRSTPSTRRWHTGATSWMD